MTENEELSMNYQDFIYILSSTPNNWWQMGFYLFHEAEDNYKLNEKRRKIVYKKIQNTPHFVCFTADQLARFSKNFSFQIPRFSIYYLLIGYSIENWLKGYYIIKYKKPLPSELLNILSTHDLIKLINLVNFKIDREEKEILTRIIAYIRSFAKYPIEINSIKHFENIDFIRSPTVLEAIINCEKNPYKKDKEMIDKIYSRLKESIGEYCEKNPTYNSDFVDNKIKRLKP